MTESASGRCRLDPGESSALHTHEHDYVMIQIAGDKVCADFEPDSQDEFNGAALGRLERPCTQRNRDFRAQRRH